MAEEELPTIVQGKVVHSKPEARLAVILMKHKEEFIYQYPLRKGRERRGGLVVDFVLFKPRPTPVDVRGEYWHRGQFSNQDRLEEIIMEEEFHQKPIVLWGDELGTLEQTEETYRRKLA